METKELIQLIETLKAMGYGHIDITHKGTHVMLDTNSLAGSVMPGQTVQSAPVASPIATAPVAVTSAPAATTSAPDANETAVGFAPVADDANLETIESPIVGTFYESPSPDADAYVTVGSKVKKRRCGLYY